MRIVKKTSIGGAFIRKEPYEYEGSSYEADVLHGDTVKINNKGDMVSGEFGDQYVFEIETRNGAKNANFNQSSLNILVDEFGEESENWVGKEVKVLTKKGRVCWQESDCLLLCDRGVDS